jgi:F0F1-type ATP synthase epsilon subunit
MVPVDALVAPSAGAGDRVALLEAENVVLRARLQAADIDAGTVVELDDERVLQDVGIYRYHHPLENAVAYRERLDGIGARIAELVKARAAIEKSNMFTFNGSLAKGRSFANDLAKLMLRAYNAEAENVVRTLRAGNLQAAMKRLEAARTAIAKLGKTMEMRISDGFHALRREELELTADYLIKKEEEREIARAERERLREERKVEQELAAAKERLEKERAHLVTVIDALKASGVSDPDLEQKLSSVDNAILQNDYRAANIRAGYVYVISNRGALGDHVVKIGLTRRLEPLDRINELGDASVPFRFDVHAIYFSEDAVKLESELHDHFASRRMNWANNRKEFFFASPVEVRSVLAEKVGNLLEFVEHCESTEYYQSVHYWPQEFRRPGPTSTK